MELALKCKSTHGPEVEEMKRIILNLLLLSFVIGFLGACNTVAGAGKDVQKAGEEVQESAGH